MAKLTRRNGKGNYEIQVPLPVSLRRLKGTPAIYRSLGTPDRQEAKRRFPIKLLEVEAEIAAMQREHFPDEADLYGELRELLEAWKQADDTVESRHDISEKDALQDLIENWASSQRQKRLRRYRGTPDFERQKQVANEIEVRADEIITEAVDRRKKITDLAESWRKDVKPRLSASTQEEYERNIKRFLGWCRTNKIVAFEGITRARVREFIEATYEGRTGKTVKLAISGLRGVWDHAATIGWIEEKTRVWLDHNYADDVIIGTGERKGTDELELPFSFDDIKALLPGLKPTVFGDIYRLGLITGARSSELSALSPEDLVKQDDGYWLQLSGTKTKSAKRSVPVPTAFNPLMDRLASEATGSHLLPFYPKREFPSRRDRDRYINKEINRKRRDLKLPNQDRQGHHSCRRTFIEMLEAAGVTVDTVKLLVGHKRTDITFGRYSKGQMVDLRSAVDLLEYPEGIVSMINQK